MSKLLKTQTPLTPTQKELIYFLHREDFEVGNYPK